MSNSEKKDSPYRGYSLEEVEKRTSFLKDLYPEETHRIAKETCAICQKHVISGYKWVATIQEKDKYLHLNICPACKKEFLTCNLCKFLVGENPNKVCYYPRSGNACWKISCPYWEQEQPISVKELLRMREEFTIKQFQH